MIFIKVIQFNNYNNNVYTYHILTFTLENIDSNNNFIRYINVKSSKCTHFINFMNLQHCAIYEMYKVYKFRGIYKLCTCLQKSKFTLETCYL